jgi:hypothetical protein
MSLANMSLEGISLADMPLANTSLSDMSLENTSLWRGLWKNMKKQIGLALLYVSVCLACLIPTLVFKYEAKVFQLFTEEIHSIYLN